MIEKRKGECTKVVVSFHPMKGYMNLDLVDMVASL